MRVTLTPDMRAVIQAAHLCFAATVSPEGMPNLSPKGSIRVWDDQHLFFLDIASPGTRANLQARPWMELNVVDQLSRRGYRFFGPVTVHVGDAVFEDAMRRVHSEEQPYPGAAVILLALERVAALRPELARRVQELLAPLRLITGAVLSMDNDSEPVAQFPAGSQLWPLV